MFRALFILVALYSLTGCASVSTAPQLRRFVGQWETGIAASYFCAADGQTFLLGVDVPQAMVAFQDKQPHRRYFLETLAYYEVTGGLTPNGSAGQRSGVEYELHIKEVSRMEAAHHDLPPFIQHRP